MRPHEAFEALRAHVPGGAPLSVRGPRKLTPAPCPICGATLAQMEIELDGYHDRAGELWGIGLSYEGLEPPGAHLLVGVFNLAWLERERRIHFL